MNINNRFYWEIDPIEIVKNNTTLLKFENTSRNDILLQINTLIDLYKKESKTIVYFIEKINKENFFYNIEKILEKEALLSEIYFYLIDYDWNYNEGGEDIVKIIQNDYLRDYYWKFENLEEKGYPKLLVNVLNRNIPRTKRMSTNHIY
ncbi:hypothetical protein IL307_13190 [Enterococcus faecium]|uniref:Uncharacterized protein n=1 Tax=Enterococcus faecium TaxID=1352 RepID=A0A7V7GK63_ENTFC|nr:hypothetical protein [Enterococcus faecium]KAA0685342.1 hypothetical protein DTX73_14625 [Enterococcus faecium]MBK5084357.1 hypothetical protein [Enterococcus faecium]MBK5172693.1 hypothetical protein [Enterococcus faecium]HBI2111728.1 hypothetical protein [Enterococcus faecium]